MSYQCEQCGANFVTAPEDQGRGQRVCKSCQIKVLKRALQDCMNLVPTTECLTFSGDVAHYVSAYIGRLGMNEWALNERLAERTKAYEEKDARQVIEISALKEEIRKLNTIFEFLDSECEVLVGRNKDGSDLVSHNAFLNPEHRGTLKQELVGLLNPVQQ